MRQLEDGATDGEVGGLRFVVVTGSCRIVTDELFEFIHLAAETGDFLFQLADFIFGFHK
jgi:hypothetical protein